MMDDESVIVSSEEEDAIVKEMVQAIMMLDHSKKPFKQSDITSCLSQKPGRKCFNELLEKAKTCLNSIGLDLVETKDTTVKSFFVISTQRPLQFMYKYASEEEVSNRILLTLVLAYIFMKNGKVTSEELVNHLKKLEICNDEDTPHPYFGNAKKKVLHDFVGQLYLSSSKVHDSEMCEITWGQRADVEVTKISILEFVCQYGLDGKIKPDKLASHYTKATGVESQVIEVNNCGNNSSEFQVPELNDLDSSDLDDSID